MSRADKAVDKKVLGVEGELEQNKSILTSILAPLVLADTLKNAAISKDIKVKEAFDKSVENYPESVFKNQVEGIDVVTSYGPNFSAKNPSTAAAMGLAVDVLDPISLAATAAKLPITAARLTQKTANSVANKMVDTWVKQQSKKKTIDNVEEISKLIKNSGYRGKLSNPENLREVVNKDRKEIGSELAKLLQDAKLREAPLINREDIKKRLLSKAESKNASRAEGKSIDIDKLSKSIDERLKPYQEKIVKVVPNIKKPKSLSYDGPPPLPEGEVKNKISNLTKELESVKTRDKELAKQAAKRKSAEEAFDAKNLEQQMLDSVTLGDAAPPPIPKVIDVPPPVPKEAVGGRNIEEVLKELSEAKLTKENMSKTNKAVFGKISKDAQNYLDQIMSAKPTKAKVKEPYIGPVDEAWELKKSLRKQLRDAEQEAKLTGLTDKAREIRELVYAVDDDIAKSLSQVNFPEGNAADLYKGLNYDFEMQSKLLDIATDATVKDFKQGGGGVVPGLVGGVGGYVASKAAGASTPAAAAIGYAANRATQKLAGGKGTAMLAKAGDVMSQPLPASIATQAAFEGLEEFGPQPPVEIPYDVYQNAGRTFQSVGEPEEIPYEQVADQLGQPEPTEVNFGSGVNMGQPGIVDETSNILAPQQNVEQKIQNTLNPQPMTFNPYINEEVLNTPLPRDSQRLMDNPTVLKAKLSQAAPDYLPILEDMLQNDPEGIKKAGPMISKMAPSIFERDDYDTFDGKIFDPMMQQKFLVDLKRDEGIDSIQKAKLALKVRRGEPI